MPVAPNHKKLVVTNKNKGTLDYATDMRTIEQWANALQTGTGITEITTGTPGVLTITNPTGPTVNIDSTGGGSGSGTYGFFTMTAGPDGSVAGSTNLYMGPGTFGPPALGASEWLLVTDSGTTPRTDEYSVFSSWLTTVPASDTVNFLPIFQAPTYTGGGVGIQSLQYWACTADFSNFALYYGFFSGMALASGATYQVQTTDLTLQSSNGTDLVLTAGTGEFGNGLVSSGGGQIYFAAVQINVNVDSTTTFT